ncbi:DUF4376 domain-containing protein [Marinobacterium litorale]|uniref:DUF4376 domain-containing protein n=1 Tax=Marinobacterium litorale TaxID=404770 RepID=UPI00146FA45F|nr:DUF4376 domain-containing protein [Marinobacterium litorale]
MLITHKSKNKNSRYNEWRDHEIEKGINWGGSVFQIDEKSRSLIGDRALKVVKRKLLNEPMSSFVWRTKMDTYYTFSPEEFLEFAEAVDSHFESIMIESWNGKDSL